MDIPIYFGMPLAYWIYSKSLMTMPSLFELGYPAHPWIIERRRRAINKACFFAPSMLKNEIEYMHGKISGVMSQEQLAKILEENKEDAHRYEKEFETGSVGLSMIMGKKARKQEGKKFRVVVEHGELYLECIDPFEEIFEIS